MTINANQPVDQVLNALWPLYIRENRAEINEVWGAITGLSTVDTIYEMGAGEFTLEIGVDIANLPLEVISLTGVIAVDLDQITKGTGGMLKIIRAGDANVTVKHDASYISLNGGVDIALEPGNILGLVNIGGDPDTSTNGIWYEVFSSSSNASYTAVNMGAGETILEVGVDLSNASLEVIGLTADVAVDLTQISDGFGGMLKIIRAGDSDVTVKHNASYISLSGDADYALESGNILGLINIGGDPSASINGIWYEVFRGGGSGNAEYTAVNMTAGQTALVTGTDINNVNIETIALTADAAVNLTTITLGEAGTIKHIIALDNDITVVQNTGSSAGGTFYLNSPAGVDLAMQTRDVLTVVNIGGDGVTASGYWLELNRKLQV